MINKPGGLVRLVKIGACLGTFLSASSAVADNIITYSGVQCNSSSTVINSGTYANPEKGYDPGTFGAVLRCPLTRVASDAAGSITSVIVRASENSTTSSIKCRAISCDGNAGTCDEGTEGETGAAFTGSTHFNLGSVSGFTNGFAYIVCSTPSAPATYRIYSYRATD